MDYGPDHLSVVGVGKGRCFIKVLGCRITAGYCRIVANPPVFARQLAAKTTPLQSKGGDLLC